MTTVSKVDGRIISYVKGSPECVLAMCGISGEERKKAEAAITNAEENAMRVIAFAHKKLDGMRDYEEEKEHTQMESNMVFDGFVAISDPLRADVYDAVKCCRSAGVGVKILTGDNIITASAIASELDLLGKGKVALEAKEIEEMSDDELCNILPQISVIARSTPSVKMRIVKLLNRRAMLWLLRATELTMLPRLKMPMWALRWAFPARRFQRKQAISCCWTILLPQ